MANTALMNTYGDRPLTLVKGKGCRLWDIDGKVYLDALAGIAVCGLGHCHESVSAAIGEQAGMLTHTSNLYNLPTQQRAAEKLQTISGMDNVFFSNSGAEANEAAIKIARKYAHDRGINSPVIITMTNSFHGRTLATLSATGNKKVKTGFTPLTDSFIEVPFDDIDAVSALSQQANIVAVLVEPVQGEGGINIPDKNYLTQLRTLCNNNQWLLMLDEIQTGNGRTGHYFAFQEYDWFPDVLTTAKGLGNGMPIGACLAKGAAAEVLQPGNHGSTYGGNPIACKAATAVMDTIINENLCEKAHNLGRYFNQQLTHALANKNSVTAVRNKGLLIAVELNYPCGELVNKAIEKGLLINVTAVNVIRLLPPLVMTQAEADQVVSILSQIID